MDSKGGVAKGAAEEPDTRGILPKGYLGTRRRRRNEEREREREREKMERLKRKRKKLQRVGRS